MTDQSLISNKLDWLSAEIISRLVCTMHKIKWNNLPGEEKHQERDYNCLEEHDSRLGKVKEHVQCHTDQHWQRTSTNNTCSYNCHSCLKWQPLALAPSANKWGSLQPTPQVLPCTILDKLDCLHVCLPLACTSLLLSPHLVPLLLYLDSFQIFSKGALVR